MGDKILGRAYVPGLGMHYVEPSTDKDIFVLRRISTGETRSAHRSNVQWR